MHILIVGAGISGLTLAIQCARLGMNVSVFEKAPAISEVGAGIQLSPNATRVLFELGFEEQLRQHVFEPEALDLRIGRNGNTVFSIDMRDAETIYRAPYFHIHRSDLINILAHALNEISPNALRVDKSVTQVKSTSDKVTLTFQDNEEISGDIVVGADGIHSIVRHAIHGDDKPVFTGNVAWRGLIPVNALPENLIPPRATVWTGHKCHAVTYYVSSGKMINFVGITEQSDWTLESWTDQGDLTELKQAFSDFAPPIKTLVSQMPHCFRWALHDRLPLSRWSSERMCIMGDAAHPMLPFLAQGAAMGIEDGFILAHLISKYHSDFKSAFETFENLRKPRTSKVQAGARVNMRRFHHSGFWAEFINYLPMQIVSHTLPNVIRSKLDWMYHYDAQHP